MARRPTPRSSPAPVDAFAWHELLDRASLAAEFFDSRVAAHPACAARRNLAREARAISDRLFEFYQLVGKATPDESASRSRGSGKR